MAVITKSRKPVTTATQPAAKAPPAAKPEPVAVKPGAPVATAVAPTRTRTPRVKLNPRDKAIAIVSRFAARGDKMFAKLAKRFSSVENGLGEIAAARGNLKSGGALIVEALRALPADWKPARTKKGEGAGAPLLEAGAVVQVREKHAANYGAMGAETAGLKVVDVRGALVQVQMSDGAKAFIPRGHLMIAKTTKPADARATE